MQARRQYCKISWRFRRKYANSVIKDLSRRNEARHGRLADDHCRYNGVETNCSFYQSARIVTILPPAVATRGSVVRRPFGFDASLNNRKWGSILTRLTP